MGMICETSLRVRYAETDAFAVVYHSNYIVWFEVGRVDLLRKIGFSYREMELDGINLPVVEVRCRYKQPARFDDELIIRTRLIQMRAYLLRFKYEIFRKTDNALLAEGETVHVAVGPDLQKLALPAKYSEPFLAAISATGHGAQ